MTSPSDLALVTDLYELTMAQSYYEHRMLAPATFSLFIRRFPLDRPSMVAAGLEDVLRFLEGFRFSPDALAYLDSTGIFSRQFLGYLSALRFTGDVWALPEGALFFPNEPILEVTAPIIEAQLVETYLINQVNLQSLIATKAARCIVAARGRALVDFALRRTHGVDAGLKVARASYLVGFASTSNAQAGKEYGIPVAGTMAHSYVSAFQHEADAFRAFVRTFPERSTLLIDTYDTLEGARRAAQVAKELEAQGQRLQAVRLDSGDLVALSRQVRRILDEAGCASTRIFASGGLDEFEIEALVQAGAPIDAFGVGTKMGVSADAPWTDMAYKLVRYDGRDTLKLSAGKATLPGEKQIYRFYDSEGKLQRDVIALRDEPLAPTRKGGASMPPPSGGGTGEPLLAKVMENGKPLAPYPTLDELRARFREVFARLPEPYKALRGGPEYPVAVSPGLAALQRALKREIAKGQA